MTLPLIIKNYYQETIMNDHKVKGFIDKTRDAVKRITGKLVGQKASATQVKVRENNDTAQAGHGVLKDGVKKTT